MGSFYAETEKISVLQERIEELARIRQGFAAHLGSSLYEVTKSDEGLRWGRESLYDGIAACDKERARLLERINLLSEGNLSPQPEREAIHEEPSDVPSVMQEEEFLPVVEGPSNGEVAVAEVPAPEEEQYTWPEPDPEFKMEPVLEIEPEPEPELEPVPEFEPWQDRASDSKRGFTPETEADYGFWEDQEKEEAQSNAPSNMASTECLCPNCGSPVRETDVFCMSCGMSLEQKDDTPGKDNSSSAGFADNEVPTPFDDKCPVCGEPIRVGDKFCISCGTPLESGESSNASEEAKRHVCPACGNPIDPSFKFCMVCGHKL